MATVDDQMSGFPIQRVANGVQLLQAGQRISHVQQGAIPVVPGALVKQHGRNIQVNHPAGFMESLAIFRINDHTAACGQHDTVGFGQFPDRLRLTPPKPLFTLDFENGRYRNTGPLDYFVIGIEKWAGQAFGQLTAHRCFAGPHETDEVDVATIFHVRILAD